jgi:hypothetical protein
MSNCGDTWQGSIRWRSLFENGAQLTVNVDLSDGMNISEAVQVADALFDNCMGSHPHEVVSANMSGQGIWKRKTSFSKLASSLSDTIRDMSLRSTERENEKSQGLTEIHMGLKWYRVHCGHCVVGVQASKTSESFIPILIWSKGASLIMPGIFNPLSSWTMPIAYGAMI